MKKPLKSKKINSRKKGNGYELKIAKEISKVLNIPFGPTGIMRTPGSGAIDCRADLKVHPDYRGKWPFFMELKNRQSWRLDNIQKENWEPYEWFKEAKEKLKIDPSYDKNSPVILLLKRNNLDAFVMMDLKYFEKEFCVDGASHYNFNFQLFDVNKDIVIIYWKEFLERRGYVDE